jgi:hypothetical protein
MNIDLERARTFLSTHGRALDRRRFDAIVSGDDASRRAIVAGLNSYRNGDGGFGWGLEPDFRASESQPQGAQHALEALVDAAPTTSPTLGALFDWLSAVTLPDGGVPFSLPVKDPEGCAPFFLAADPSESSLQATSIIAAHAYQLARWDNAIAEHPWLVIATRYCFDSIRKMDEAPMSYVLSFCLQFLDAASDTQPESVDLLHHLARFIPRDGALRVEGGAEGESIHPLDYSPEPGRPTREHIDPAAIAVDIERVANGQQDDGGWSVDFDSYSPAAALEWRGYATVNAVAALFLNEQ